MKFSTRFLLFTLAVCALGLLAMPAMADVTDTQFNRGNATDPDSAIINGLPADLDANTTDTRPGMLYVGYNKTNGTKTSAQARGTQDTAYTSDTVLAVPTGEMQIIIIKDGDSAMRVFGGGYEIEGFSGWTKAYSSDFASARSGETLVHRTPVESGETFPVYDSIPTLVIETMDTGTAYVRLVNTSNYACTMTLVLHLPDTDFRVHRFSNYAEKADNIIQHFRVGIASDTTSGVSGVTGGEVTAGGMAPLACTWPLFPGGVLRLAEDAETYFIIRVAAETQAQPRDSLCITVMCFPDSGPMYNSKTVRLTHDTGYYGYNDTKYGDGGSEDSVSLWTLVATALVRVKKTDTIYTPNSFRKSVSGTDGETMHMHDTVPGAIIMYTITYDNDGNRRADSIELIDFLDSNVDFYIGMWPNPDGQCEDTFNPSGITTAGVDTRLTHGRYRMGIDTGVIVEFAARNSVSFAQETWWAGPSPDGPYSDSTVDTVGAIKIRWQPANNYWSLARDQIDDLTYPASSNVLDPLYTIDTLVVNRIGVVGTTGADSGDAGRIRFAVVIR